MFERELKGLPAHIADEAKRRMTKRLFVMAGMVVVMLISVLIIMQLSANQHDLAARKAVADRDAAVQQVFKSWVEKTKRQIAERDGQGTR